MMAMANMGWLAGNEEMRKLWRRRARGTMSSAHAGSHRPIAPLDSAVVQEYVGRYAPTPALAIDVTVPGPTHPLMRSDEPRANPATYAPGVIFLPPGAGRAYDMQPRT
jgi:hypothetical protein